MEDKVLTEEEKAKLRKERRKRRKYRLLILLLLLLGTGTMLATSTYAWFTSNKNVSVNSITVNIEAKNGIQISADGTNWKSIVQTSDLTGVHATTYTSSVNQIPNILEPVSTIDVANEDGGLTMYYGTVDTSESEANNGEYILTAVESEENDGTEGQFIAFDLFFKVNAETPLYLVAGSGATASATDTGIKNASRIGFVVKGNTADGSAINVIQGLNNQASSTVYIWEPNYDIHTNSGVANAKDVYGIETTTTNGAAVPYSGVKAVIPEDADILLGKATAADNGTYFAEVTPDYKTVAGFTTYQPIFSLATGITKIRIYMWVEGQDVDCENSASGGAITFDLKISTENPDAEEEAGGGGA